MMMMMSGDAGGGGGGTEFIDETGQLCACADVEDMGGMYIVDIRYMVRPINPLPTYLPSAIYLHIYLPDPVLRYHSPLDPKPKS